MSSHEHTFAERTQQFQSLLNTLHITNDQAAPLTTDQGHQQALELLRATRKNRNHVFLVGNGGSAGVAAHATTDMSNLAKLRVMTLHESALVTCLSNDFGYDQVFSKQLANFADPGDLLIAISSSGQSANILNAATAIQQAGGQLITLSGFDADNPLRQQGNLNYWLDSHDYGMVEIAHLFILHYLAEKVA